MKKSKKATVKFSNFNSADKVQVKNVLGGATDYNTGRSNTQQGVAAPHTGTATGTQG
jgi:hypothetical protein